jgi:hypothetical protein
MRTETEADGSDEFAKELQTTELFDLLNAHLNQALKV